MAEVFRFPDPVNEVSARLVAAGVVVLGLTVLIAQAPWLIVVMAYGFLARVLTGPTLSPLGQLVTRVITPSLGVTPRYVPGPPKRFAQGIGALLSVTAAVAHLAVGATGLAYLLVGAVVVAASLEAALGFCLGCKIFALAMQAGIVPDRFCAGCADLSARPAAGTL